MPPHYTSLGPALRPHALLLPTLRLTIRPFHTTSTLFTPSHRHNDDPSKNHYETLKVAHDATHAEIKRSYFALSKAHHPDHNPADPHASRRFMRISEAYAVLGHAEKRTRYDREVMRFHSHPPHHHHKGSYHSTHNPAGGRPATGLSRRRGTFTGPPPSFFRSGGWGSYEAKRKAAHEESTGASDTGSESAAGTGSTGGMGPGQNPWKARNDRNYDIPHFDREAHERTQKRHEERRTRRMAKARGLDPFDPEGTPVADFLLVAAILCAVMFGPLLIGKLVFAPSTSGNRRTASD
ncbi:hypothetical protein OQA88_6448 [Cercophora sp. LCS_1]